MATFLSIFMELPLTPMEDERWQGVVEPDLRISLPAAMKPPGRPKNHDT
jgi:hypothetical protein